MQTPKDHSQQLSRQSSDQPTYQLGSFEDEPAKQEKDAELALFHEDDDDIDEMNNNLDNHNHNYQSGAIVSSNSATADWDDASPNFVLAKLKQIKPEVYKRFGLRSFYKSYNSWEKMTGEQRNKVVAWYRKLSPEIQGIVNVA